MRWLAFVLLACAPAAPPPPPPPPPCEQSLRGGSFYAIAVSGPLVALAAPDGVQAGTQHLSSAPPISLTLVDLNGDGAQDIVAVHGSVAAVWLGPGFETERDFPNGGGASAVVAADFDRDGHDDVAVVNQANESVSVLSGRGDGTLGALVSYPTGLSPAGAAVGDFDHDGRPDLAIADFDTPGMSVLLSRDGGFAPRVGYPTAQWPLGIAVGDFDRDGFDDLAVACSGGAEVDVFMNDGGAGFTLRAVPVDDAVRSIVAADFDGDGQLDLAVAHYMQPGRVGVLKGVFGTEKTRAVGVRPSGLAAGDLDGDGLPDVLVADDADGGVTLLSGRCL
jgi:hypothetical protein